MSDLHELHAHLYGCLTPEDLPSLAARNEPRWNFFRDSYRRVYGGEPELDGLFDDTPEARARLESYYLYRKAETFAHFQCCFDLLISISSTSREEIRDVYSRVFAREPARFAEYRQMFAPVLPDEVFKEKVLSAALAAAAADEEHSDRATRLAVSVFRVDEHALNQYRLVREVMRENDVAAKYITGVDFCAQEEGHPPMRKESLFREILEDNEREPDQALAVLYHVGESYVDKSVESAVRWVVQAARLGAHRLGHAVALAVNPELYQGTLRLEIVSERRDQIAFELDHLEELRAAGYPVDGDSLRREQEELRGAAPDDTVEIRYDEDRVGALGVFQDWAMGRVRETKAVIESCPTSNLRIAGLAHAKHHPLPRFLKAGLPVTLAADDPGILDTTLDKEYELAAKWEGVHAEDLETVKRRGAEFRSERLSGRIR